MKDFEEIATELPPPRPIRHGAKAPTEANLTADVVLGRTVLTRIGGLWRGSRDPGGTVVAAGLPAEIGAGARRAGKARNMPIEDAIIGHYLSREGTAEEALLEIYHTALSMCRAEAVAKTLWSGRVGVAAISTFNRRIAVRTAGWRNRPIRGSYPYVFLGLVGLKVRSSEQIRECRIRVAVGVNLRGYREVLGVAEDARPEATGWRDFVRHLRRRGLAGVRLFVSDPDGEVAEAIAEVYPESAQQICLRQLQRDLLARVPTGHLPRMAAAFDAVHACDSRAAGRAQTRRLADELGEMRLPEAAALLEQAAERTGSYYAFPREHWKVLRSNFPLMRILRQIRERARVVGPYSGSEGAILIVCARLRSVARQWSGARSHLDMRTFAEQGAAAETEVPGSRQAAG